MTPESQPPPATSAPVAADPPTPAPPAETSSALTIPIACVLIGAVVALVGLFTNWVTINLGFASTGVHGIDTDDGKLALGALAVAVVTAIIGYAKREYGWTIASMLAGLALAGIAIYDGVHVHRAVKDISDGQADLSSLVGVGTGIYLVVIGGGVIVASALWLTTLLERSR